LVELSESSLSAIWDCSGETPARACDGAPRCAGGGQHIEGGTALAELFAHIVAGDLAGTFAAESQDQDHRPAVLVLDAFRGVVDRFDQLGADLPAAGAEPAQPRAQLLAIVGEVENLLRLDQHGRQRELSLPEERLHELGEARLESAGALIGVEDCHPQRDCRRRGADDLLDLAADFDLEVGRLQVCDRLPVLVRRGDPQRLGCGSRRAHRPGPERRGRRGLDVRNQRHGQRHARKHSNELLHADPRGAV